MTAVMDGEYDTGVRNAYRPGMSLTIESLVGSFTLTPVGEDTYTAPNAESGHAVIFGGQLLGQSIVAASLGEPDKRVKTVHTIFARAGSPDAGVEIAVERLHSGRAMASASVSISQGPRLVTRSQVLLSADEPDFISHADAFPSGVSGPSEGRARGQGAWEIRTVGDADISDPAQVGPPDLDVWIRFAGAPSDAPVLDQALLAFATDGFLIGTAMRPHDGVGQSQAHRTLSTGVLSHTLTFHEPFSAGEWLLLSHHSTHAGHGRCYGRANVFREDGTLVASFVQDAMIRPMAGDPGGAKL
jgi:acyl-CoA thioesterase